MNRRRKGLVALVILLLVTIPLAAFLVNLLNPPPPEAFSLDDAPSEIIGIKIELKQKLETGTFSWEDVDKLLTLSQYIADHSPAVKELIQDWSKVVVFHITDEGYFWFITQNDEMTLQTGLSPPSESDIAASMNFDTLVRILKFEITAVRAFQDGDLDFTGPLGDAVRVNQLVSLFAATIMDTSPVQSSGILEFMVTEDNPGSYIPGLTLFPCTEAIITNDSVSFGVGSVVIINSAGQLVARRAETQHWVHEFINSTTVLMGAAGGTLELWNFETDVIETLPVPGGHHDFDYNPATNTYLILENDYSEEVWDERYVLYDLLSEYSANGTLLWQWDGRDEFPFNSTIHTSLGLNETFRAGADWMHSNSFVWDKAEDAIYLNVRNIDTILKIDKATKEILWSAGRWGEFSVLNKTGHEVDTIFHHPHSLEKIGPNQFIIYDNNLYNPSEPSTMSLDNATGFSRMVEFEIDEGSNIMRETWSWTAENLTYYFPESGGDADRLPNGNTIGTFGDKAMVQGVRDPVIITEVTPEGEIAWEVQIPGHNDTYYWAHRLERFYEAPLVDIHDQDVDLSSGTLHLNLSTWNCFKQDSPSAGMLTVLADGSPIHSQAIQFLPYWQSTNLEVSLTDLSAAISYLQLIIENDDGLSVTVLLHGVVPGVPILLDPGILVLGTTLVAVPVILVLVYRYKRTHSAL